MATGNGSTTLLLRRPLPPLQKKENCVNYKKDIKSKGRAKVNSRNKPIEGLKATECHPKRHATRGTIGDESDKMMEYQRRLELMFANQKPRGADPFPLRSPKKAMQIEFNAFIDDSYEPPPPAFRLEEFLLKAEENGQSEHEDNKVQTHLIEKPLTQWHVYEKRANGIEKQRNTNFQRIFLDENVDLPDTQPKVPYRQKLLEARAYNLQASSEEYNEQLSKAFGSKSRSGLAIARPTYMVQKRKLFIGEDDAAYEAAEEYQNFPNEKASSRQNMHEIFASKEITDSSPQRQGHDANDDDGGLDGELFLVNSPLTFFQGGLSARSPSPFDAQEGECVSPVELAFLECIAHGGIKLNLKAHFVDQLPFMEPISATLVHINLSFNDFLEIPEELFEISQLETLKLRNNPLSEIPDGIKSLTKLKTLILSFCLIYSVPQSLFQLENLEKLDLSYNRIAFIPDELKNLRSLKVLNLEGNQLTSFPRGIILLDLRNLNVNNNFIHPLLWRSAAPPEPQQLLENCATVLALRNQHLDIITEDVKLKSLLKSMTPCDFCGGPKFGQGIRVIKPAAEIFGVKNLPILFFVCSQNCKSILRRSTELSIFTD